MFDNTTLQRFLSKIDTSGGPDACHPWTGLLAGNRWDRAKGTGRGHMRVRGKWVSATRYLLGHSRGLELAPDELALHRCDNPRCCNLAHLYVGDHAQNMRDKVVRGNGLNCRRGQTHCKWGHAFTEENTYRYRGWRVCKQCMRNRGRARRAH